MAKAIREINKNYNEIVVVIGDGHVEGIRALIQDLGPDVIRLRELREYREDQVTWGTGGEDEDCASVSYSFELRE